MIVLVVAVGGLVWAVNRSETEQAGIKVATDALWVEQTLRFQLAIHEDLLVRLALEAGGGEQAPVLDARTRLHIANNPEVQSVSWYEPRGEVRRAVPGNGADVDPDLVRLLLRERAQRTMRPIYGTVLTGGARRHRAAAVGSGRRGHGDDLAAAASRSARAVVDRRAIWRAGARPRRPGARRAPAPRAGPRQPHPRHQLRPAAARDDAAHHRLRHAGRLPLRPPVRHHRRPRRVREPRPRRALPDGAASASGGAAAPRRDRIPAGDGGEPHRRAARQGSRQPHSLRQSRLLPSGRLDRRGARRARVADALLGSGAADGDGGATAPPRQRWRGEPELRDPVPPPRRPPDRRAGLRGTADRRARRAPRLDGLGDRHHRTEARGTARPRPGRRPRPHRPPRHPGRNGVDAGARTQPAALGDRLLRCRDDEPDGERARRHGPARGGDGQARPPGRPRRRDHPQHPRPREEARTALLRNPPRCAGGGDGELSSPPTPASTGSGSSPRSCPSPRPPPIASCSSRCSST